MSDDKKNIEEIERISREYWDGMGRLKEAQNNVVQEYIQRLEEKKKEELLKKIANS